MGDGMKRTFMIILEASTALAAERIAKELEQLFGESTIHVFEIGSRQ